jgi:hypothetical protein
MDDVLWEAKTAALTKYLSGASEVYEKCYAIRFLL